MPSQMKNWFARHMAPPPPLNATPTCPCARCFNVIAQRPQTSIHQRYSFPAPLRRDSDVASVMGAYGYQVTTTKHIEMARNK
ncbi:hypothetical protein E4U59_005830 [Claviceps monticola]|nr:hypothetical protein E4U59_005830 [Claviceps monticola]